MSKPRIDGGGWNHSSIKPERNKNYEAWIVRTSESHPPVLEFIRQLGYCDGWPKGMIVLAWRELSTPSIPKHVTKMMEILMNCHAVNQAWQAKIDEAERKANERATAAHRPGTVQHADGLGG